MANIDFNNLTPDNGAIRDLSHILLTDIVSPERLGRLFNIFTGVYNGDKMGVIGEFGLVGVAETGCSPEYSDTKLATAEKTWDIAGIQIAESICYADLLNTFVKYDLNSKEDDELRNAYLENIVLPRLRTAISKAFFRVAFFGDKQAANVADGGVLKAGVAPKFFNLTDGFWKQLVAITTADNSKRVTIAANAEATYADQRAAITASGVATGIIDAVIAAGAPALRGADEQVIYVTLAFKDALDADLKKNYPGSDLHWEEIFAGIRETTYNGITLRAVPQLDEIIQGYESNAAGTGYNNPYRVIYTTKSNLLLGVNGVEVLEDVDIIFDRKERKNYYYAKDRVGALVADDNLVVVGF